VLLLTECLLLLLFISLSTQSGNLWIHPCICICSVLNLIMYQLPEVEVKGKVDSVTKHHAFLISTLDGGEWTASRSDCFTPAKELHVFIIYLYK
jgi:hypothetical protein